MIMTNPIGSNIQDFKILNKIGTGGFATVYRAKCLQPGYEDHHVAIKMINQKDIKKKKLHKRVESEIDIHSSLSHPAVVKFFTWFEDENYVYLVLELCEEGSLEEYIKCHGALNEKDACHVIKQVIDGVRYLHARYILHRDLSLKNILLMHNMQIKIADFGMAAKLRHPNEKKCTMLGTANFISPEVVRKESYDSKVDCWSVGCVLYALLFGKPPFDGKEKKYMEIMNDAVMSPLEFPYYASSEAKKLLEDMLNKDPNYRINIYDPLQYPFFQKYTTILEKSSEFNSQRSADSGLCSLSSSRSTQKSYRTNESAPNSLSNNIKEIQSLYGNSVPTDLQRMHIDKNSGSYHSLSRPEFTRSREERPRSKSPTAKERKGCLTSVSHLKNKIQTLPSRQQAHDTFQSKPVYSGHPYQHQALYYENRQESQIDNVRVRSHIESPLPYPLHRLQNIVEDHLDSNSYYSNYNTVDNGQISHIPCNSSKDFLPQHTSCSHDQYCAPENRCSHELVCCCHQYRTHSSIKNDLFQTHKDKNKQSIEIILERNTGAVKKGLKDAVAPLNSVRLVPKRYTTKNAIVSILNDGQVCLEFLKLKRNKKFVSQICFISRDGWTILFYKPKKNLLPANEPPPLPNNLREVQYFNFETLPETHWKKYQYAKRFIDIVTAKTPKVIIYGKDAKCVMMENADFEVHFYNGCLITQISGKTTFETENGSHYVFAHESDLTVDTKFMWDVFSNMKQRCKEVEASLERISETSKDTGDSYFPVIIGRKPSAPLSSQDTNKENFTPQSHNSSALHRAISAMKSYDTTMNTDSSPYSNSLPSAVQRGKSIVPLFRSIVQILQNLKDLPRVENNKVVVEYKDGIQMWSSKDGQSVYFYDTRTKTKLTNIEQKPEILKRVQDDLSGILFHVLYTEEKRQK